jgi:hypothetical protein
MFMAYDLPGESPPLTFITRVTPPTDTTYDVMALAPEASAGRRQLTRKP